MLAMGLAFFKGYYLSTFVLLDLMLFISTFGHFTISHLYLRIFRTNVISTFEIFVLGNFNSMTFSRMLLWQSHFSILLFWPFHQKSIRPLDISCYFVLSDPMWFRPFDISPKVILTFGHVDFMSFRTSFFETFYQNHALAVVFYTY